MQAGACRCEFFLGWGPEWARWELPCTLLPPTCRSGMDLPQGKEAGLWSLWL